MVKVTVLESQKFKRIDVKDLELPLLVRIRKNVYRETSARWNDEDRDIIYLLPALEREVELRKILAYFGYAETEHNLFHIRDMGTFENIIQYFGNKYATVRKRSERNDELHKWKAYWDTHFYLYSEVMYSILENLLPASDLPLLISKAVYEKPPEPEPVPEPAPEIIKFGMFDLSPDLIPDILNSVFELVTGREPTLEDVLGISKAVNYWLPFTNVFAKAIFSIDLNTGEAASYKDVTASEIINAAIVTGLEAYGIAALSKLGAALLSKIGASGTQSLLSDFAAQGAAVELAGGSKFVLKRNLANIAKGAASAIAARIKKSPLLTVFVISEIPNYFIMQQFARKQVQEEFGETAVQASFALKKYEDSFESVMFEFKAAIDNEDKDVAIKFINQLNSTRNLYEKEIEIRKEALTKSGDYDIALELLSTWDVVLPEWTKQAQALAEVTPLPDVIPEVISGDTTGVIDGDTIDVTDMTGVVWRVRLIGIDAPEFKTAAGKDSSLFLTDLIHGKRVEVKVDPNNQKDKYDRVLGVVFLNNVDINRKMLEEGHANYYFIGSSKYYSDDDYKAALQRRGSVKVYSKPTYCKIYIDQVDTGKLAIETFELTEGTYVFGVTKEGYRAESQTVTVIPNELIEIRFELEASGLGDEAPPIDEPPVDEPPVDEEPEEVKFKIYFTSSPGNAKLWIDDVYTHHWTPSNEKELSDVMELLSLGSHKVTVTKAGMKAETTINVTSGDNGVVHLLLETVGLPPPTIEEPVEVAPTLEKRLSTIEENIELIKLKLGI